MSKNKNSGQATPGEANATDTTALTIIPVDSTEKLNEKLNAAKELSKLIEKRKKLASIALEVADYEEQLNGEDELISLQTTASRERIEISRPETIVKILTMLKTDVANAQDETDKAILAIAI